MRINKFVAQATGASRRSADALIASGRVYINDKSATAGDSADENDSVTLDNKPLRLQKLQTIALNKPVGYVCSRKGQGSKTIYDLLPVELHNLKPIGRLDKDSSGLILLTNDGTLANQLTHPSQQKTKVYEVTLYAPLSSEHLKKLIDGVKLDDGLSVFDKLDSIGEKRYKVSIHEGRNRQIRRTFEALGHGVAGLHRIQFGDTKLEALRTGKFTPLNP